MYPEPECSPVIGLCAIYSPRRVSGTQKPATTIKMAPNDPSYMGFLPALDTAMVAAWHEPKVRGATVALIVFDRFRSSYIVMIMSRAL